MILYHTGYQEIRLPDVHLGRTNADFGQGFYLSDDEEFSRRWARSRPGNLKRGRVIRLVLRGQGAAGSVR